MSLAIVSSPRFADHLTPPGHPESPERAAILEGVAERARDRGVLVVEPRSASDEELLRVHTPAHVAAIEATRGRAVMLDPDTFTSPESADIARLAAGAALSGVDVCLDAAQPAPGGDSPRFPSAGGTVPDAHRRGGQSPMPMGGGDSPRSARRVGGPQRVVVLVRPPGHHAEPGRAMGFCFYNNVAVAAAHARARGIARVAIVDVDVHHGNGTQDAFYADPDVLFVSVHQYPFYPGTGAATECGSGDGRGYTVNLPMDRGATDGDYRQILDDVIVPVVRAYDPGLILVSAGFDAHEDDPLAQMRMTTDGYAWAASRLAHLADAAGCGLVLVTEGGYALGALAASLDAVCRQLEGDDAPHADALRPPTGRGMTAIAALRAAGGARWAGL